jgi:hypothetical protein
MYSAQGIFQPHFQCKKVHTILNKIQYITKKLQKFILKNFRECTPSSDTNVGRTRTTTNVFLGSNPDGIRHLDLKNGDQKLDYFFYHSRVGLG